MRLHRHQARRNSAPLIELRARRPRRPADVAVQSYIATASASETNLVRRYGSSKRIVLVDSLNDSYAAGCIFNSVLQQMIEDAIEVLPIQALTRSWPSSASRFRHRARRFFSRFDLQDRLPSRELSARKPESGITLVSNVMSPRGVLPDPPLCDRFQNEAMRGSSSTLGRQQREPEILRSRIVVVGMAGPQRN